MRHDDSATEVGRFPTPTGDQGKRAGFTLVQALFALAILGLIAGLAVPLASQVISADRSSRARQQLERLRAGLVGPQDASGGRSRPDFGYLGDLGALPSDLTALLHQGGRSSFQVNGPARIGVGWRGPYYPVQLLDDTTELRVDPFGRSVRYDTADTTLANGTTWDARLRSAGPDGEFGTGDDLVEGIPRTRTTGDLVGVVTDTSGTPQDSIDVGVTFRRDGSLVDTLLTTDSQGEYRVNDLAFGTVAVSLGKIGSGGDTVGALQYVSGSASVTGGGNPDVRFSVKNTGNVTIDISGWIAIYDDQTDNNQTIYYGRVNQTEPVNKKVFDVNDNCPGSGTSISFSDQVTVGTGTGSTEAVNLGAVRTLAVDGPEVRVSGGGEEPLQVITISGEGDSKVRFEISDFATGSNCGGGSNLDMTNRTFEVSFSDGSTISFTTPSSTS